MTEINQANKDKILSLITDSKHHGLTSIEIDGLSDISPDERYEIVKKLREEDLIYFSIEIGGRNRLVEYQTHSEKQQSLKWSAT
jgi:hypothetical protein